MLVQGFRFLRNSAAWLTKNKVWISQEGPVIKSNKSIDTLCS